MSTVNDNIDLSSGRELILNSATNTSMTSLGLIINANSDIDINSNANIYSTS